MQPKSILLSAFGILAILIIVVFCAGFGVGNRFACGGKPEGNYIDSSVLERISEYQREYIQTRYAELEKRESDISKREKLVNERESRFAETSRIIETDRAGYAEIERLARETIKIISSRNTNNEN